MSFTPKMHDAKAEIKRFRRKQKGQFNFIFKYALRRVI